MSDTGLLSVQDALDKVRELNELCGAHERVNADHIGTIAALTAERDKLAFDLHHQKEVYAGAVLTVERLTSRRRRVAQAVRGCTGLLCATRAVEPEGGGRARRVAGRAREGRAEMSDEFLRLLADHNTLRAERDALKARCAKYIDDIGNYDGELLRQLEHNADLEERVVDLRDSNERLRAELAHQDDNHNVSMEWEREQLTELREATRAWLTWWDESEDESVPVPAGVIERIRAALAKGTP